jgi:hypothetical protein
MKSHPHFLYQEEIVILPPPCCDKAPKRWAKEHRNSILDEHFSYQILSNLKHGIESINEFIRITTDNKADVNMDLFEDVIALAKELKSDSIIHQAILTKEKFDFEQQNFAELLETQVDLHISSVHTEEAIHQHSIAELLNDPKMKTLNLALLYRCFRRARDIEERELLFNFFIECLSPERYGKSGSMLFCHLNWNEFSEEHFDRLANAGFDWSVCATDYVHYFRDRCKELKGQYERLAQEFETFSFSFLRSSFSFRAIVISFSKVAIF